MTDKDSTLELAALAAQRLIDVCPDAGTVLGENPADTLWPVINAILAEAAAQQWIQKQLDETGIRSVDFRNGMQMELEPARQLLAHQVAAARAMLGDAPGALTPHEARQKAETRVAELEQAMTEIRHIHKDSPMGPCPVCVDADAMARGDDGTVPYPCPTGRLAGAKDCDPPSFRKDQT